MLCGKVEPISSGGLKLPASQLSSIKYYDSIALMKPSAQNCRLLLTIINQVILLLHCT